MYPPIIPYSERAISKMKYTFSHILNNIKDINKNRYNLHYEVYISEPRKYPEYFPRSFAYWRQKIDLLAPHRFSSIIYDKITKKRKLKYIMDDSYNLFEFVNNVKKYYPDLKIEYIRHQEFY